MPTMEFASDEIGLCSDTAFLTHYFNYMLLCATSYHPTNRSKRLDHLRYMYKNFDAHIADSESEQYFILRNSFNLYREKLGGNLAIANSSGTVAIKAEFKMAARRAMPVGKAFMLMFLIAHQLKAPELVSINRIAHLLEKTDKLPRSTV